MESFIAAVPCHYLPVPLTLLTFLGIPAALGVIITMTLPISCPRNAAKTCWSSFSTLILSLLYPLFRLLQPEKLVNPEAFSDFLAFLSATSAVFTLSAEHSASSVRSSVTRRGTPSFTT